MQRSVAFHRNDAVRDDEMRRHRAVDIEDAPVDPLPMENVLRPPIDRARDGAEHVFMLSVTFAQWCVFTLGIDTKSPARILCGIHSESSPVKGIVTFTCCTSFRFKPTRLSARSRSCD